MGRLCERPGCSQPADVIFGIDAERLVVWFEGLDGHVSHRAGVLCRRHADSMVPPVGWTLDDRRTDAPRLFAAKAPTPVRPRAVRRSRTSEPVVAGPNEPAAQLSLDMPVDDLPADDVPADDVPPAPSAPPPGRADEPTSPVWRPKFDQSDDLGGLLTARSPLLSRAFRLDEVDDLDDDEIIDLGDDGHDDGHVDEYDDAHVDGYDD